MPPSSRGALISPVFHLHNAKAGVNASAQQIDGEFTMLAGSKVVGTWHGVGKADSTVRADASYREKHAKLVADGSIRVDGAVGTLVKDVVSLRRLRPELSLSDDLAMGVPPGSATTKGLSARGRAGTSNRQRRPDGWLPVRLFGLADSVAKSARQRTAV